MYLNLKDSTPLKLSIKTEILKELIQNGGVQYKESAISYIFNCPRCSKWKLYLHKVEGFFKCFVCAENGFKGRPEYALTELYNLPISSIRDLIYGQTEHNLTSFIELDLRDWTEEDFLVPEEIVLNEMMPNPDFISLGHEIFQKGLKYLLKRGISLEQIKRYNIQYNPLWKTVVFPVRYKNTLYGWQERSIDSDFKYTSKGLKKDRILMFQDNLLNSDHCFLGEGPVDALKGDLIGGNICSMGKGVSVHQLNIIKKHKIRRLYLGLDPDAASDIRRICNEMYDDLELYLMKVPYGKKDFGACSLEDTYEQYKSAQKYKGQAIIYLNNSRKY